MVILTILVVPVLNLLPRLVERTTDLQIFMAKYIKCTKYDHQS